MSNTATITTPPRVANSHLQDAALNVMLWASVGSEACPSCGVSAAARDCKSAADGHAWWRFIRKVRQWLEDPDSDAPRPLLPDLDLRGDADMLDNPVILDTREADGETQRAIADMLSWSLASAQTQCCGNSLGPEESAQRSIAELCGWLGMTWAQLEAAAQRWSFELDDPMKAHRVRRQPSGWRA